MKKAALFAVMLVSVPCLALAGEPLEEVHSDWNGQVGLHSLSLVSDSPAVSPTRTDRGAKGPSAVVHAFLLSLTGEPTEQVASPESNAKAPTKAIAVRSDCDSA